MQAITAERERLTAVQWEVEEARVAQQAAEDEADRERRLRQELSAKFEKWEQEKVGSQRLACQSRILISWSFSLISSDPTSLVEVLLLVSVRSPHVVFFGLVTRAALGRGG